MVHGRNPVNVYSTILFFFDIFSLTPVFCDSAEAWQLGIQDPATAIAESMIYFHNYLMFFLVLIGSFVSWMLYQIIVSFNETVHSVSKKFTHSSLLEIVWTIIPAIILLIIAVPSFSLLYSMDEIVDPKLTVKVIGHQWYWSYEYSDYMVNIKKDKDILAKNIIFESYMIPTNDLSKKTAPFRLLETDNRLVLPTKTHIRVLVTSADVIHSWAIPAFGVKIDATPGRLSQISLFIKRPGIYYGQCSEICGINHGFMPIVVKAVALKKYRAWMSKIIADSVISVKTKTVA